MKMKLQTSLEFIVLLSAVALFSVFVLSQYLHLQGVQKAAYETLDNQTLYNINDSNSPLNYSNSLSLIPIVPNTSYTGKNNNLEVIVAYPPSYKLESLRVNSMPNISILPPTLTNVPYSPIEALTFAYLPKEAGQLKFAVVAVFDNASGHVRNMTEIAYSYALQQNASSNASAGNDFVASIGNRSEAVLFPVAQQSDVIKVRSWSHCAYHNTTGRESEPWQCGSNTWGFIVNDNTCNPFWWDGQDRYYCFSENKTGSKIGALTPQQDYKYSADLSLDNSSYTLEAHFTNSSNNASLEQTNTTETGHIQVDGVYASGVLPPPYMVYAVRNDSGRLVAVNYSYYENYSSTESSLVNILKINNGTWVDNNNLNYVQKTLLSLAAYEQELINAQPVSSSSCTFYTTSSQASYSCEPEVPFSYYITVFINSYTGINQSLQYMGSSIVVG